jgi:hypothetical protein
VALCTLTTRLDSLIAQQNQCAGFGSTAVKAYFLFSSDCMVRLRDGNSNTAAQTKESYQHVLCKMS